MSSGILSPAYLEHAEIAKCQNSSFHQHIDATPPPDHQKREGLPEGELSAKTGLFSSRILVLTLIAFGVTGGVLLTVCVIWLAQGIDLGLVVALAATAGVFLFTMVAAWSVLWLVKKVTDQHWSEKLLETTEALAVTLLQPTEKNRLVISKIFVDGRGFARSSLRGFIVAAIAASLVVLATATVTLAGFVLQQLQVQRLTQQNELLRTQNRVTALNQDFESKFALAQGRYQEISGILLNPDSTPNAQAFALELIPEAMQIGVPRADRQRLDRIAPTADQRADFAVVDYPNLVRLRFLLLHYLRMDRVGHALAKAGLEQPPQDQPMPSEALSALRLLAVSSTALLETLHRLGPNTTNGVCLWNFDPERESIPLPDVRESFPDSPAAERTLRLDHLRQSELSGLQAPYALSGRSYRVVLRDGANLAHGHLEGANLANAEMPRADLTGARLEASVLNDALLTCAMVEQAHFEDAKMERINLEGAVAKRRGFPAYFSGAVMLEAKLSQSDLFRPHFEGAVLKKAFIEGAHLSEAAFYCTDLIDTQFGGSDLTKAIFQGATIHNGGFNSAKLTLADFSGALAANASFLGATLQRTTFYGALLVGAKFSGANLTNALFAGAHLCGATFGGVYEFGVIRTNARSVVFSAMPKEADDPVHKVYFPGAILHGLHLPDTWRAVHLSGLRDTSGADLFRRALAVRSKLEESFFTRVGRLRYCDSMRLPRLTWNFDANQLASLFRDPTATDWSSVPAEEYVQEHQHATRVSNCEGGVNLDQLRVPLSLGNGTNAAYLDAQTQTRLVELLVKDGVTNLVTGEVKTAEEAESDRLNKRYEWEAQSEFSAGKR